MKAAQINEYGNASVVHINETDTPKAQPGQVVVEVYDSSLNPFDSSVRSGKLKDAIPLTFPATLGGDIAGVITEVSSDVTEFKVGDKVYGQANVVAGNSGAFAQFAATAAGQVAAMPASLTFQEAGSLPLVGVSALQAITDHLAVQAGQKVFIHGGAGGIGSIAIQIAKNIGAYVATTATDDGIMAAKKSGADEVIDYKTQDFSEVLEGYDAVFDTVGGDDFTKSLSILKHGGTAVSMIAKADEPKAQELEVTAITQSTKVTTAALNKLTQLVEDGIVTPHIGKVFQLEEIQAAFESRESGSVNGKVVIEIKHD